MKTRRNYRLNRNHTIKIKKRFTTLKARRNGLMFVKTPLPENTGALFDPDNLNAFPQILEKFLDKLNNNKFTPREWIIQNYGKYNSGKKLKTFVQSIFKEDELNFKFQDVEYLKPAI